MNAQCALSRGVAILAALTFGTIASQARADCKALDGIYANESSKVGGSSHSLTEFAPSKESSKLFLVERPAGGQQQGFTSGGLRARPKITPLTSAVRLHYTGGRLMLAYIDANGKTLAETAIGNSPAIWKCVGSRLERKYETVGGLGDQVRTRRTQESLFTEANGDLHFAESTTIVGLPGEPQRVEVTFKRVAAVPARTQ